MGAARRQKVLINDKSRLNDPQIVSLQACSGPVRRWDGVSETRGRSRHVFFFVVVGSVDGSER